MRTRDVNGFSVIEAVIAVSLLAIGVSTLAQVSVIAARTNAAAQRATIAQQAARERIEQLRALTWSSDAAAVPITDWSSDLSVTPQAASGGVGLSPASTSTLTANTSGYCDFLDAEGRWLARGARAPAGTAWTRRWSISMLDDLPDTLVLQVVVLPTRGTAAAPPLSIANAANGVWLMTMHTRRLQ